MQVGWHWLALAGERSGRRKPQVAVSFHNSFKINALRNSPTVACDFGVKNDALIPNVNNAAGV